MRKVVQNATIVSGQDLKVMEGGYIVIEDGRLLEVGPGQPPSLPNCERYDAKGLLAIPGLVNAHTHIGDSVAKEVGLGLSLKELVHPIHGIKGRILSSTPRDILKGSMVDALSDMLRCGITTFADFREGGLDGVRLLQEALQQARIRAVVLGRPNYCFSEESVAENLGTLPMGVAEETDRLLELCDGIGLSGPNEYTDSCMNQIAHMARRRDKIISTHASESEDSANFSIKTFGRGEVERAVKELDVNLLVHLTRASDEDIGLVSERRIPVACCPRSNATLGVGFPPILKLIKEGIRVALGTDNVMLNSPDLFREMDYTSKVVRAIEGDPSSLRPKEVLEMVTVNAARALRMEEQVGSIEEGKRADMVLVNMKAPNLGPIHDPIAALVHRVRPDNIEAVMLEGVVVHGSIKGVP